MPRRSAHVRLPPAYLLLFVVNVRRVRHSAVGYVPTPSGRSWQAIIAFCKYKWLQHRVLLVGALLFVSIVLILVEVVRD